MSEQHKVKVAAALAAAAQREAQHILDETGGAQAVVVATMDGFDIATALRARIDPHRIAALASSIAAIGEVVSVEAKLGKARSVTVDTDGGFAVVFSVARVDTPLVINVIAGPGALVGEVNYRAAAAARALAAA
ncbi:roadblock/LC7 domain-containing protein [Ramlibacter albus]|uniref:Roadblock/LC7 domain-containing protein n=1 Tax=Ramlibacter albus TaxID=2079448 RepID=A0A923S4P2_9BURK|nr:roadblock/LC7 domain-containing protein [Ramlibacter albus]MBC5767809.1 roadblock/LC7 domain-containing protein [Ramlibacter albus]